MGISLPFGPSTNTALFLVGTHEVTEIRQKLFRYHIYNATAMWVANSECIHKLCHEEQMFSLWLTFRIWTTCKGSRSEPRLKSSRHFCRSVLSHTNPLLDVVTDQYWSSFVTPIHKFAILDQTDRFFLLLSSWAHGNVWVARWVHLYLEQILRHSLILLAMYTIQKHKGIPWECPLTYHCYRFQYIPPHLLIFDT